MSRKYDKYCLSFSFVILLYLIFRYNHLGSQYSIFDILMVYVILLMIWFMKMNYRHFVMSISRLQKFGGRERLEYCTYSNTSHDIEEIYVRACKESKDDYITDTNWYKLDSIIGLYNKCNIVDYRNFVKKNTDVRTLLKTMHENYILRHSQYLRMKSDYNCFRYLTLFFIILGLLINLFVYYNI